MAILDARQREALEQAAHWFSQLHCEDASPADQEVWGEWLDSRAENRWAWEQVQQLQQRLHGMPSTVTGRTLHLAGQSAQPARRAVLKGIAVALGVGVLGYGGYRQGRESGWMADYRTVTGERRSVVLADGTQLQINTRSSVDVQFDAERRRVILREGELLLTTAADPARRPFFVETPFGLLQALGTRFSVRLEQDTARIAVYEHQVRVSPLAGAPRVLDAGSQCSFNTRRAMPAEPLMPGQDGWSRGVLVANDQRLDSFLAELGRYRSGWLRCDPAVAALRISGTFSLNDTDQALRALASTLPVRVEQSTRYWVTVAAR